VKADSLDLRYIALEDFRADVSMSSDAAEITSVDAGLFGGQLHATGKVQNGNKPDYSFEGQITKVGASELCAFFKLKCTGGSFDGDGKVEMAGFTDKDLANSAKGSLHFDWKKGTIARRDDKSVAVPPLLTRFDQWSADAAVEDGGLIFKENNVRQGARKGSVSASIKFGDPPTVSFAPNRNPAAQEK
jgi:hypothetical protein